MSQADLAHHFYRREPYPFPLLNFPSSLPVQFIHNSYCPQITDRNKQQIEYSTWTSKSC